MELAALIISIMSLAANLLVLRFLYIKHSHQALDEAALDLKEYGIGLLRIERLDPDSVMIRQVGKRK